MKNENNSTIYLFDLYKMEYVKKFDNIFSAIEYFISCLGNNFFNFNNHRIVDDEINMNGNDKYRSFDWESGEVVYYTRQYMFIDNDNRIIDIRLYKKEFQIRHEKELKEKDRIKNQSKDEWDNLKHGDKMIRTQYFQQSPIEYDFRCDPVPGLINRSKHRYTNRIRHTKTMSERRTNTDVENKKYVRPKRKYLPTTYDDIQRGFQKNWKRHSKKRKQWM